MFGLKKCKKKTLFAISLIITVIFAALNPGPAFYRVSAAVTDTGKLVMKLSTKDNIMYTNTLKSKIEKPFIKNNVVFIPLNAVFDAIGAEINLKEKGNINLIYRITSADIKVGALKYSVNQKSKTFKEAPVDIKGTVMVPLDLVKLDFGLITTFNTKTGEIKIILEDDGALTDLSFLTDSISSPSVGNSYFSWSIRVPNGSRLQSISFNSKIITVTNEHRGMTLKISVDTDNKKTLAQLYDDLTRDPIENFGSKIIDSSKQMNLKVPFIEFLYINPEEEAVIRRMYIYNNKLYTVSLQSYEELDPKKLKANKYYKELVDSFKFGYSGTAKDVKDTSTVKYGLVKYENYAVLASENKYFTWEMNVIPEWNQLKEFPSEPLETRLGVNSKEYIKIYMKETNDISTLYEYVNDVADKNKKYLNPKKYKFLELSSASIAGFKTRRLQYTLEMGGINYIFDIHYFINNGIIYEIAIKASEDRYKLQKEAFYKTLESLKLQTLKLKEFKDDLNNFEVKYGNIKAGEDDKPVDIQNKKFNWELKIPGYWMKDNLPDENVQLIFHPYGDISIAVEALENTSRNKQLTDEEKFSTMGSLIKKYKMKLISKDTYSDISKSARVYKYRLESEEDELFADVNYYIIEKEKFSYCFTIIMADVYATEANIREVGDIFGSFKPGE